MDGRNRDEPDRLPAWQGSGEERQIDADAYHIWTPRPLIRSVYWRPDPEPPREAVSGSYEVFVDQRAFASMHEHVWKAQPGRPPFGYLIGDLCEDPSANRRFLIITAAVPSRFPFREKGPEQIDAEASVALQLEVERRRGVQVGWYHSHPAGDAVLSAEDVATHERLFREPWQVALLFVCDAAAPAGGCFRRTPDGFDGDLRLPFYEMVTNESLLAKGVRRSRVDWVNVSTLDKIRLEPLPRPEAPPEVEPRAAQAEPAPEALDDRPRDEGGPAEEAVSRSRPETIPEPVVPVEEPVEPSIESEVGETLPASVSEVADAEEGENREEELNLDALIAEVEQAGLPRDDGRAAGEPIEVPDRDADPDSILDLEEVASIEADTPPVPESVASPDAGFELEDAAEAAVTKTELPEADTPPVPVVEREPAEPDEPAAAGAVASDRDIDRAIAELGEVEAELALDERAPGGAISESVDMPHREETEQPLPRVVGGGRRLPKRLLAALGIVIALVTAGVLFQLLGNGEAAEEVATPSVIERQTREEVAPAGPSEEVQPSNPVADSAAVPVAGPQSEAVSLSELESLSDRVLESISTYYGRDGAYSRGEIECAELQAAFVEVMDSWIDYNTRGKAGWQGRLPPDLVERDERLYLGVQDVERLLEASSCPRP